jgi:hypothetical protein
MKAWGQHKKAARLSLTTPMRLSAAGEKTVLIPVPAKKGTE